MTKYQVRELLGIPESWIEKSIYDSGNYRVEKWMVYRECVLFLCAWSNSYHYYETGSSKLWIISFENGNAVTSVYY